MLYYGDAQREVDTRAALTDIDEVLAEAGDGWCQGGDGYLWALRLHPDLVGAAIALGEIHQAVADSLCPRADGAFPETDRLAEAGILVGRCVFRSWELLQSEPPETERWRGGDGGTGRGRALWNVHGGDRVTEGPVGAGGSAGPPDGMQAVLSPVARSSASPDAKAIGLREQSPLKGLVPRDGEGDYTAGTPGPRYPDLLAAAREAVSRLRALEMAPRMRVRVPEGYAFYSLYPESYFRSLQKALQASPGRTSYTVIGIRSIGTSLATLVAGALRELGLEATVETVRPRGHPFKRFIKLAPSLQRRLTDACDSSAFLVVDEGPGLTCSSFLSACATLEDLGASEQQIAALSAWRGMPSVYASGELRTRWARLRVYYTDAADALEGWRALVPFVVDALGQNAGRLVEIEDLSYGRWRERCYPSEDQWPVVHRPTERTKLLFSFAHGESLLSGGEDWRDSDGGVSRTPVGGMERGGSAGLDASERSAKAGRHSPSRSVVPSPFSGLCSFSPTALASGGHSPAHAAGHKTPPHGPGACIRFLAKFAGLGKCGEEKMARAEALAEAGFSPPVAGLAYGFLLQRFVEGRPLEPSDLSQPLMARIVTYYAFVARNFGLPPAPRFGQLSEMILLNAQEALGLDASPFLERWRRCVSEIDDLPLVRLDGRPFAHEWLEVAGSTQPVYLKVDSADHFRDHTVVGEQSILWDLAGACEEWEMDAGWVAKLLASWETETGDGSARQFLDFYRAAYLAFRTAALHYAIHSTNEEEIRGALQHQQRKVDQRLTLLLKADG